MKNKGSKSKRNLPDRAKKAVSLAGIAAFVLLSAAVCVFAGIPLVRFVSEPELFRGWVDSHGVLGRTAFVGITVLQIFIAVIPGEPMEIGAGYAFGVLEGTLLCMLGILIGSSLVFLFVRYFGVKAVEVFFPREKINSLKFLRDAKRLNTLMFIVFFIPGTPKDLLSYFAGLTNIRFPVFLFISAAARIPSVVTSVIGGDALGTKDYGFAIVVFSVTLAISAAGLLLYNRIGKKGNRGQ